MEIPPHAHCKVCAKAIPEGSLTCSKACAARRAESQRSKKLMTYLFYGVALFLVIVLFLSYR